jgi:SIR2-like domain
VEVPLPATRQKASDFAAELARQLSVRTRHVVLFVGAGAARSVGLPDMAILKECILEKLDATQRAQFEGRDLEAGLSRIRRLISILKDGERIEGLTLDSLQELDTRVCTSIIDELRAPDSIQPFEDLAAWSAGSAYIAPIEIITPNYDLLIEQGLDSQAVMYFDGFVGTLRGRFREDLIEPSEAGLPSSCIRLWKLHGSINWEYEHADSTRRVIRLGSGCSSEAVAIYPSDEKYEESRRVPFIVLMDRFRRALAQTETICFCVGYSFRDEHLNDILRDAAVRYPRNHFVCLSYGDIPDNLVTLALKTPSLTVIAKSEYIAAGNRSAYEPEGSAIQHVSDGNDCLLGDFTHFSAFLRGSKSDSREP